MSEILIALTLLPLAFTDLRATIDGRVTCSDASEGGGGMCVSRGITEAGLSVLEECMESLLDVRHFRHQHVQSGTLACHVLRVICVGLFDGLGGLRIAFQKLGKYVIVILYISCEIEKPAKRLVRKRWPGVVEWGSVLSVSHDAVNKIGDIYQSLTDAVIIGAGSPCQDLSSLNAHRVGLSGNKSRFFLSGTSYNWTLSEGLWIQSLFLRGERFLYGQIPNTEVQF